MRQFWKSVISKFLVNKNGELFYNIFVPTTPNPTSGYLLFINAKDTKELNLSVEEGLKIIISGGMVAPEDFLNKWRILV